MYDLECPNCGATAGFPGSEESVESWASDLDTVTCPNCEAEVEPEVVEVEVEVEEEEKDSPEDENRSWRVTEETCREMNRLADSGLSEAQIAEEIGMAITPPGVHYHVTGDCRHDT